MTLLPSLMLAFALGLLIFPFPAFFSRRHSYRALQELDIERRNGSWTQAWRRVLRFPWHWTELARGAAGSWLTITMLHQVGASWPWYPSAAEWAGAVIPLVAAYLSILLSALLFTSPGKQPAPVFFTGAVVLTTLAPAIALPSLLLGGAVMLAMKSLVAFFLVTGPIALGLGLLFEREPWPALAAFVFATAPVLIAAGRNQDLLLPLHRSKARAEACSDSGTDTGLIAQSGDCCLLTEQACV